jgi:sarcosine oxidase subunit gamma
VTSMRPLRRSFVHRRLVAAGAQLVPFRDALAAAGYGDPDAEREALGRLALADLSPLPRAGFKGSGTVEWLEAEGVPLPATNQAKPASGELVVRLGTREVLVLSQSEGPGLADRLQATWPTSTAGPRGYPVPRQDSHFWFLLKGEHAPACLAKLCAVDLRPHRFAELEVAQTQAMRLSVIIIRDAGLPPAFHLLGDSASTEYAWDCLVDAMREFDGRLVGLTSLS